jgi:PAS domain S-box-containing protein
VKASAWPIPQPELLLEEMPCGVVVMDRDLRIVAHNRAFGEMYGQSVGQPCFRVYKDRGEECPDCVARKTFADGRPRVLEESGVDGHGQVVHYLARLAPLRDPEGKVSHLAAITTDLTATKLLQREYQTLFEKVPCYVTVLNRDRRVVKANEMFRRTFGEPRGEYCYHLFKQRHEECENCPAARTFTTGVSHTSRQVGRSQTGEETHYVVSTAPLRQADGQISHVIEMCLDVTEMKELEREKVAAERLAAVGQTVAGLAHGIKNVLMGLEGGMYAFQSGMTRGDNERMLQGWRMLEENINRITTFVKEFLEFARGREPEVRLVDPNEIAAQVVSLFRDKGEMAGIELRAELQPGIPFALMDSEGIHSCLTNLVSNALDACEMSDRERRRVVVRSRDEDGVLVLEVADNGTGIDYEIRKKVFTTFFSTKGANKGTGLGLLTTRKIVQQHGGRVSFESTAGEGSTFRLEFPRDRLPAQRVEESDK